MATPTRAQPRAVTPTAAPTGPVPAPGQSTGWVDPATGQAGPTLAPGAVAPTPAGPPTRAIGITEEDKAKAATRGITPEQSAKLDTRLAMAQTAYDSARATMKPGDSGRIAFDAMMKAFGPPEPWMAAALAAENNAMAGDPYVYNGQGAPGAPGLTVTDESGRAVTIPYPSHWTPAVGSLFMELTQDPKFADEGEWVPDARYVPAGYSVRGPSGNPIAGLLNPVGEGIKAGADAANDALGGLTDWAVPDVDTSSLDRFSGGGGGGAGGTGGGAGGGPVTRDVPMIGPFDPLQIAEMTPAEIAEIERINQREMRAAQTGPIERARIATVDPVAKAEADRIRAATIDPVARAEWERMSAAGIDPAAMATAAKIRRDEQAEMRARQLGVLSQLEAAARGEAPSVAALMLKRQAEENIANQRGFAAQARGSQVGLAAMNAATNVGILNQKAALDQALLRAQEMDTARGRLGQATDAIRGQDISLETSQAGFEQQTSLANQGATNTRAISQAQLEQDAAKANQATGAQSSQFNAGQINVRATNQAQLTQDATKTNQATELQVAIANAKAANDRAAQQAALAQQAYSQDASAENARALEQARLEQQASAENLRAAIEVDKANQAAQNQKSISQAQLDQDAARANQGEVNDARQFERGIEKDVAAANQGATLQGRGIDDTRDASLRGDDIARENIALEAEKAKLGVATERIKAEAAFKGGAVATGGSLLGTTISDARAKTSVRVADDDIQGFLDALSETESKSWRYKKPSDPRAGEGRQYGKMAQDIERSAVGKTFVDEAPDGLKVIDVQDAIGPMLAALAQVNARLNKIEKRRR